MDGGEEPGENLGGGLLDVERLQGTPHRVELSAHGRGIASGDQQSRLAEARDDERDEPGVVSRILVHEEGKRGDCLVEGHQGFGPTIEEDQTAADEGESLGPAYLPTRDLRFAFDELGQPACHLAIVLEGGGVVAGLFRDAPEPRGDVGEAIGELVFCGAAERRAVTASRSARKPSRAAGKWPRSSSTMATL